MGKVGKGIGNKTTNMNQEYRERVKRHLEAGGDPKYVSVKVRNEVKFRWVNLREASSILLQN